MTPVAAAAVGVCWTNQDPAGTHWGLRFEQRGSGMHWQLLLIVLGRAVLPASYSMPEGWV